MKPTRRAFLAKTGAAVGVSTLAGCSGVFETEPSDEVSRCDIDRARERGTSGWPTPRGDHRNTGAIPTADLPDPPLTVAWSASLGGFAATVQPVSTDETVVTTNADDVAVAFDAVTGDERWRRTMENLRAWATLVGGRALLASGDGLHALDLATGEAVWTAPHPDGSVSFGGSPGSDGDVVVVGTDIGAVALDDESGDQLWTHRTGLASDPPPAVVDGTVYVPSADTYLYALDAATGERQWRFKTGARIRSAPVVVGNRAFVGSNDGTLYALDAATGDEHWRRELGGEVWTPAATGGHLFVPANPAYGERTLTAIRADTGEECWRSDVFTGTTVAAGLDYLYAPVESDEDPTTIGAFDPRTGEVVWRLAGFDGRLSDGPAVADGRLFVGGITRDGVGVAMVEAATD
jgi:outer membrane protein assembly factor BamB